MEQITQIYYELSQVAIVRVALIAVGSLFAAFLAGFIFNRVIISLSKKTRTDIDDEIANALRKPIVYSFLLVGAAWVVTDLSLHSKIDFVALGIIKTVAVLLWSKAAMRVGTILLEFLSAQVDKSNWIQPKTLPLFDMVLKVVVIGGSLYFALVAWNLDVTSWLASAGIVGIAVGFAAKDTVANLFAGVFILADTPYKIGDFIILDNGVRGVVTDIGVRSTRLLTRDDIEITVPNAVIANSKIINETGGPHQKMRVRVKVSVAYGSDVEKVDEILMRCVENVDHVSGSPEPRVRFRGFGDSGLDFELLAWIDEPVFRGRVLHALNTKVYNAFNEAGIEIPYPKRDVYIKQQPETKD